MIVRQTNDIESSELSLNNFAQQNQDQMNTLIDGVNDLRNILPNAGQIQTLITEVQTLNPQSRASAQMVTESIDRLQALMRMLPTDISREQLGSLRQLNLPTRDDITDLMQVIGDRSMSIANRITFLNDNLTAVSATNLQELQRINENIQNSNVDNLTGLETINQNITENMGTTIKGLNTINNSVRNASNLNQAQMYELIDGVNSLPTQNQIQTLIFLQFSF